MPAAGLMSCLEELATSGGQWFWWSRAEPITWDTARAAETITRALRGPEL